MRHKINIFESSPVLGGFSLSVRDDWSYNIKKVNISENEKKLYKETFGEKLITYSEFFDWWCKVNNLGEYNEKSTVNTI